MRILLVATIFLALAGCAQHSRIATPEGATSSGAQYAASANPSQPAPTPSQPTAFGIGSTREEVAAIMGPPRTLIGGGEYNETWYYGNPAISYVSFTNGRVEGWSDNQGIFPLRYAATTTAQNPPPQTAAVTSTSPAPVATSSVGATTYSAPVSTSGYGGYGTGSSTSSTYVHGYYRSNGTYVAPYYRSSANGTKLDNWSTKGNINPYTGKIGHRSAY